MAIARDSHRLSPIQSFTACKPHPQPGGLPERPLPRPPHPSGMRDGQLVSTPFANRMRINTHTTGVHSARRRKCLRGFLPGVPFAMLRVTPGNAQTSRWDVETRATPVSYQATSLPLSATTPEDHDFVVSGFLAMAVSNAPMNRRSSRTSTSKTAFLTSERHFAHPNPPPPGTGLSSVVYRPSRFVRWVCSQSPTLLSPPEVKHRFISASRAWILSHEDVRRQPLVSDLGKSTSGPL